MNAEKPVPLSIFVGLVPAPPDGSGKPGFQVSVESILNLGERTTFAYSRPFSEKADVLKTLAFAAEICLSQMTHRVTPEDFAIRNGWSLRIDLAPMDSPNDWKRQVDPCEKLPDEWILQLEQAIKDGLAKKREDAEAAERTRQEIRALGGAFAKDY
ncbi:MAG: hypothetical protein WCV84_03365 [Patescibacteria group bacterium]